MAVTIGESTATPVLIRVVNDLHARFAPGRVRTSSGGARHPTQPDIAFSLTKLGRQQFHRTAIWPRVQEAVDTADLVRVTCRSPCRTGVLAVGAASIHRPPAGWGLCRATTAVSWPLPAKVLAFVEAHENVLVLEEPSPFVERELSIFAAAREPRVRIRGRLTGHLPPEGPLLPTVVEAATQPDGPVAAWSQVARKTLDPPRVPPPYDALFRAVARTRCAGAFVAADVGSAVKLCYPPYNGADVSLCLGSAISVASGAARTGRPSIAVIGDFALLHSGLEALIDAVRHDLPVTVLVLLNGIQAQTGGQPSATVWSAGASPGLTLPELVRATGARLLGDLRLGDHAEGSLHALLTTWVTERVPGVALLRHGAGAPDPGWAQSGRLLGTAN